MMEKTIKELLKAIKSSDTKKTNPYDTSATVTRVENGVAYVHIPGGVDETPVKLTMNVQLGDEVQIRVGGGQAWITGNETAPPTDDKAALEAQKMATAAGKSATDYITDISGNGIWVTPQNGRPQNGSIGPATTGWHIADVLELFKSGASVIKAWVEDNVAKIRVGREDSGHTTLSAGGMMVYGGDGQQTLANIGYGESYKEGQIDTSPYFTLGTRDVGGIGSYSFAAGDKNTASEYCAVAMGHQAQANGAEAVSIGYATLADKFLSVAIGVNAQATKGEAIAIGADVTAGGRGAVAIGSAAQALASHAVAIGNNLYSTAQDGVVIGRYNEYTRSGSGTEQDPYVYNSGNYAFVIGKGSEYSPSNALTVDWNGNLKIAGKVSARGTPLVYAPGDTLTIANWPTSGYITSGGQDVLFFVCVDKILSGVTGFNITSLVVNLRHVGGGYVGGSDYNALSDVNAKYIKGNYMYIRLRKTAGYGLTNNTPVCGEIANATIAFT